MICLVYNDFTPRVPSLFILAIPVVFVYTYASIESEFKVVTRDKLKDIIVFIRLGQNQSLKERIVYNPELLKEKLDKKSLFSWAKHYKNLEAHSFLIELMQKHRKN